MSLVSKIRDQVKKEIAAVEAALDEGHSPINAIHVAALRLGIDYHDLQRSVGTPGWPGVYWHKFLLGVEWKRAA